MFWFTASIQHTQTEHTDLITRPCIQSF